MGKLIALDAEFYNSNEQMMNVVCFVAYTEEGSVRFDTTSEDGRQQFLQYMDRLDPQNTTLISYAAMAETRALLSLGINPLRYRWIDLYVEFTMLCNSNNKYCYGNYLDTNNDVRYSVPPDPSLSEKEKEKDIEDHSETPKNLLNALYKMLGIRDTSYSQKEAMRDLILSKDDGMIRKNIDAILEYCESDTKHLLHLDSAIQSALREEGIYDFREDQLSRGRYSVCTGLCEHSGIPINMELLQKIIDKTPEILNLFKEDVNKFFPYFKPGYQRPDKVHLNGKVHVYKYTPPKRDDKAYQTYVESLNIPDFPKTATGKYKADKDTLEEFGYWDGLESLWKYGKTYDCLKWFSGDNKNGFFERVGLDKRVRPYFGIFGTQTGRNAPKAKTFVPAMSSWLRAIIRPDPGMCIIGSDFSQQEVYVAALLSGDESLLSSYNSGDVYLDFAIKAGLAPVGATKRTHMDIRSLCKSTVLGLQYGMGLKKLHWKLRLDSGKDITLETAKELIAAHKRVFKQYWQWVYEVSDRYKQGHPLITNDGYVLFQDNPVVTSVRNYLVQGNSASITRMGVVYATEEGMTVLFQLHDAIYVICEKSKEDVTVEALEKCMIRATANILNQSISECTMRIDTKVIHHEDIWIEEKGQQDWDKLKGFLA